MGVGTGIKLGTSAFGDPYQSRGTSKDMAPPAPHALTKAQYEAANSGVVPRSISETGQATVALSGLVAEVPAWQYSANCFGTDPDLFFPERGASTREAKEVCRGCSVRPDCLEYALDNRETHGIWGGMSERERRRLRRQRALARRELEDRDKN